MWRKKGIVKVQQGELRLNLERPMYQTTHLLGGDRIVNADSVYLLLYAQQFLPLRINGRTVMASYCAYRGLGAPLRIKANTGFSMAGNYHTSNLDHIIPRSKNGEEHALNYQLLAAWYNSVSFKGALPTLHARWHAFRKGGRIDDMDFESAADAFLWVFDKYHERRDLRYAIGNELAVAWPWWARDARPPYRPLFYGYDEKRHCMRLSKEESYLQEWSVLARNTLRFLKLTPNRGVVDEVREQFEEQYRMTPEVMASYSRLAN